MRAEPHKLLLVLLLLVLAGFSNWAALAYIHDLVGRWARAGRCASGLGSRCPTW